MASPEELAFLNAELDTAWLAYLDHTDVASQDVEGMKSKLALVVSKLWMGGQKIGLAEAALTKFMRPPEL